jgi:aminoglycoside phosphotransferase (APT) family kinase protein
LLGALHAYFEHEPLEGIPQVGMDRYLSFLHDALAALTDREQDEDISLTRRMRLQNLLERLDATLVRWPEIEELCSIVPRTLVHGDLRASNVRIIGPDAAQASVIIDWEWAGWGIPIIDLAERFIDLWGFAAAHGGRWLSCSLEDMKLYREIGLLFRHVFYMDWAASSLTGPRFDEAWEFLEDPIYDDSIGRFW